MHRHRHRDHDASLERRLDVSFVTAPAGLDDIFGGLVEDDSPTQTDDSPTETKKPMMGVGPAVKNTQPASSEEPEETDQPEETKEPKQTEAPETHTTQRQETHTTNEQPTQTEHPATQTKATATTDNKPTGLTTVSTATSEPTKVSATNSGVDQIAAATSVSSSSDQSMASPSTSSVADSGALTGGAKAGIAIGVILGLGLIAGLVFLLIRKRKQKQELNEIEDEKVFGNHGPLPPPVSEPRTPAEAPQLDVRPVTQFAPFGPRASTGLAPIAAAAAAGGTAAAGSKAAVSSNQSPPETPHSNTSHRDPFGDPVNPFENRTEPPSPANASSSVSPSVVSAPEGPGPTLPVSASGEAKAGAVTAAVASGAAAGAAATTDSKISEKDLPTPPEAESQPKPQLPQTPVGRSTIRAIPPGDSISSNMSAAAPVVTAAGAAGTASNPGPGPLNVHRVQMDFNASMEDEVSLRVGQLVRLLHEYDDGWALCVRLDHSQQGVAPRSCLSSRPVKPRPHPPPGGAPGPRGPPIMGPNGRTLPQSPRYYPQGARQGSPSPSPHQSRPMPPGQVHPVPRVLSPGPGGRPTTPRSMSPGPYGPPGQSRPQMPVIQHSRSSSIGHATRPNPPVGADSGPSPLVTSQMPPSGHIPRKAVSGDVI